MNKAQQAFKNNKRLRVFLLFLTLSVLFWMLIKLSREYTTTVEVDVNYVDLPENKLLQSEPLSKVETTVKSVGFNLLKYKFTNRKATISLKSIKKLNKTTSYYLSSDILKYVSKSFTKAEILDIAPDTLYFDLGKSISKKVIIEPDLNIQYKSGYNLSGDLIVDPEYVTISGPANQVGSIVYLTTESLELKSVNDTINKKLNILIDKELPKVEYEVTEVTVRGKVEKFTEQTLEIPFKVTNLPATYKISTFPKKVKVVFQIGLSDFNKITEGDFNIVCDFSKVASDGVNYLEPKILNKPTLISGVKILPNKIEFLLEK